MKRSGSSSLLLAALLAGVAFSASAQSVSVATQSTPQGVANRDIHDRTCLRETGSRVTTVRNQQALRRARAQHDATTRMACNGNGRAYSQEDLQNTGAIGLAEALRRLDPAVR